MQPQQGNHTADLLKNKLISPETKLKKNNLRKWSDLRDYLASFKKGQFLGRDLYQWLTWSLFYLFFNIFILVFFLLCIGIFSVIADEIYPSLQGVQSTLKFSPGLAFRPVPDFESRLIRFVQGKPATYKQFTDHIRAFLEHYENELQTGENFIDCTKGRPPNMEDKVCRFDVNTLGEQCLWQKDFGYDEGQPCILLKLNRIFDWRPQVYSEEEMGEIAPEVIEENRYHSDYISVTCTGRYDADNENIGNVSYWPSQGFFTAFYPYLNQEGYRSPLVMVRFNNPINGAIINVVCRAFAKNIRRHDTDELGAVTFSLLVD